MADKRPTAEIDCGKALTLIGAGNTAEIFDYCEGVILKLFRKNMPRGAIEHEYDNAAKIHACFPDTPDVLGMVRLKERYGILYEKISGTDVLSLALRRPWKLRRYGCLLAKLHSRMHAVSTDIQYSVKRKLTDDISHGEGLTDGEKRQVLRILDGLPDGNSLCHFDFHIGNIMYDGTKYSVIDWMCACSGDPAADIARTMLLMTTGEPMHMSVVRRAYIRLCMKSMRNAYLRSYCAQSGVTRSDIERWTIPVAAARLSEWLTDSEHTVIIRMVRKGLSTEARQG